MGEVDLAPMPVLNDSTSHRVQGQNPLSGCLLRGAGLRRASSPCAAHRAHAHPCSMITAMKKLIAQVEALPENEQIEVAELLLTALKEREGGV